MQYLVENGAGVSPKDRWGGTPLDDAHRHGHREVAEFLEAKGAVRGETGSAPELVEGAVTGEPEPAAIVELMYAASEGDLSAIRRLVARGINLGGADYDRRTPLHLAAAEGHEQVVQYFIDQGVELSPRDRWGGTPLTDARRHGHLRVVQMLESHEAAS